MKKTTDSATKLDTLAEHYSSADTTADLQASTAPSAAEPPSTTERMTTFAVRLPTPLLERAREIAAQQELTTSALIRRWIDAGMAEASTSAPDRVVPVHALLELIGRTAPSRPITT